MSVVSHVYAVVVALTAAAHFAFIGYFVFGGLVALRWPKTIAIHVVVVIWCVAIEVIDFGCPLTYLERWARERAGMAPLPAHGFIDHYITGVWYPQSAANVMVGLVVAVVLASWFLVVVKRKPSSISAMSVGNPLR